MEFYWDKIWHDYWNLGGCAQILDVQIKEEIWFRGNKRKEVKIVVKIKSKQKRKKYEGMATKLWRRNNGRDGPELVSESTQWLHGKYHTEDPYLLQISHSRSNLEISD